MDKPPEVELVEEVEEVDSTIPEDCYTESETRTMTMYSIVVSYILVINIFVCLRSQTASGDVLAWSLMLTWVKGGHGGTSEKPATPLWSTAILKPSSSS